MSSPIAPSSMTWRYRNELPAWRCPVSAQRFVTIARFE